MTIKRVVLKPHHLQPAEVGATIHAGGTMNPRSPFAALEIARYTDQKSCYLLFHIAASGESTDTEHESLQEALRCAEDLYGVKESEWLDVNSPSGSDENC
jgi:hypothetical protein